VIRWQVDPDTPVDEVINDAYAKLFSPAAPHVKNYYEATEAVIEANPVHNATFGQLETMWSDAVFTTLQDHLDAAKAAVTADSIEDQRIDWVQDGLTWWQDIIQCVKWMNIKSWPYEEIDGTELATAANAIEDDTDGTDGFWFRFGTPISQSEITQNSNFAFELSDIDGDDHKALQKSIPGAVNDIVIVQVDILNLQGEGLISLSVKEPGAAGSSYGEAIDSVRAHEEGWIRKRFALNGSQSLVIRAINAKGYVDNLSMKYASEIDMTPINAAWIDLVDNTIKPKEAAWEALLDSEGRPMPIGPAAFRGGRIPEWNQTPPEPDDPDLI
jgi:hypothetical protein